MHAAQHGQEASPDRLLARGEPSTLQQAVADAEAELECGEDVDHDDVTAKLRRWADGEP
jgi:hypothetical protein